MRPSLCTGLLLLVLLWSPLRSQDLNCSGLPTSFTGGEFPNGDFFSNFDNPCYTISLEQGNGGSGLSGDLNSLYDKIAFRVDPRYQLILVGTFPNAREMSVVAYDSHVAISQAILDTNIVPLTAKYVNPFQPSVAYLPGQQYAIPVNFGGTPGTMEKGCRTDGYNVDVNGLDATLRHVGMNWNIDPNVFQAIPGMPLHDVDTPQHTNPNTGGTLIVRIDLQISSRDASARPHMIVRDVASGCAYPAQYALQTLNVVSNTQGWLDGAQTQAHRRYNQDYLQPQCFAHNTQNKVAWLRAPEYIPGPNPEGAYIQAQVPGGLPAKLASAGQVMRVRLRIPIMPPTPCRGGCARSGEEQMRYMSLSFYAPGRTLASLADNAFTQDANGYATLIVGTGAAVPPWITPTNGYTLLDLKATSNFQNLQSLFLRHVVPSASFRCAGQGVPYYICAATPAGPLMGDYLPVLDYPLAASLPQKAEPLIRATECGVFPEGKPSLAPNCGVVSFPAIQVNAVTTQCRAPGCNAVVVQPQPPLIIVGAGFGSFPGRLPFKGNSNYLKITDTTRGWSAGFSTDSCNVSIDDWSDSIISLVANVNQAGACPLAAGDQLVIQVWNPQTQAHAQVKMQVAAQ